MNPLNLKAEQYKVLTHEKLSPNMTRITEKTILSVSGVLQSGSKLVGFHQEAVISERSYISIKVVPPESEQITQKRAPEEEKGAPKEAGREASREEGESRPSPEGGPLGGSVGRAGGGIVSQPGLLPETGPQLQGSPTSPSRTPSSTSTPAPQGSQNLPSGAPTSSSGGADLVASKTPTSGPSAAQTVKGAPPTSSTAGQRVPPTLARLAEPLTRQEITLLTAMVKQASMQMQVGQDKNIFQAMLTPGSATLTPAVRGFVEKMALWEGLLQKFSSNPGLPIKQQLNELKEMGMKLLAPGEESTTTLSERQEKLEALLEGGLKTSMDNLEKAIGTLPQKEETELELLQTKLQAFSELEQLPTLIESRAEKVPYPVSLQFAALIRSREDLVLALRAMEGDTKKQSTSPLIMIPLPWERKGEGVQAGGGQTIEKEKGGRKTSVQANQQAMAYIPPGKVIMGEPEAKKTPIQLEGFFLGVVPMTNLHVATWLNSLAAEGRVSVKSGKVFFDRHTCILRTKEAAFESQIETRVEGNTIYFGVEKGSEEHPVVHMSFKGAELFCRDMGLRLPTEAEWERVAGMQGDSEKFRFGFSRNEMDPTWANYDRGKGRAGFNRTTPVGFYNGLHLFAHQGKSLITKNAVSPWGCYDMSGNVWEWTQGQIAKGGSYLSPAQELHVAARRVLDPSETYPDVGFRLALSLPHR